MDRALLRLDLRVSARQAPGVRSFPALLACVLAPLAAACGGIAVLPDGDTGGSAGGGAGGTGGSGATGGGGAGNFGNTGGFGGVGGSPIIVATITDVKLGADCQPVVGLDPLYGQVDVLYENIGGGAGVLELAYASVQFVNPMEGWVFPIELDPKSSGLVQAGDEVTVQHLKVFTEGDASFLCNFCGLEGQVVLAFADDSAAYAAFDLGCAF